MGQTRWVEDGCLLLTISKAPLKTPQKMLEYHSSSWAFPSSGSSTKSARGFSSKSSVNDLLSDDQFVTTGVMLRNILKPTFEMISAVSRRFEQEPEFDLARKSSIRRMPML